jgi:hypothetical protein
MTSTITTTGHEMRGGTVTLFYADGSSRTYDIGTSTWTTMELVPIPWWKRAWRFVVRKLKRKK